MPDTSTFQDPGAVQHQHGCMLSSEFWAHFARHHWEQRPLLIKQPFATPFANSTEIFQGLVAASERYRAGERDLPLQFFNAQSFTVSGGKVGPYLPQPDDLTTAGYAARVTHLLDGQRFAFIMNGNFLAHQAALWLRMRQLLRGLRREIPGQSSYSAVFFGNYESTPFGVHQDDKSNFQFVIEGHKTMHLWPHEFAQREPGLPGAAHYRHYLDAAITLEGEPGDVLFWPASYWHIGEAGAGLSVCLTLGLCPPPPTSTAIWGYVAQAVEARLKEEACATAESTPDAIAAVTAAVTRVLHQAQHSLDLARACQVASLNRLTSGGSVDVPPPQPWRELANDDVIRGSAEEPIRWLPAAEHHVMVSANGHAFSIPADPNVLQLIAYLNSGTAWCVHRLIEACSGTTQVGEMTFEATAAGLRTLLAKLYSLRAVTLCPGPTEDTL